ncbi:S24 family peptidase [Kingella negevensis]|uniref:S24 family peptidase n=1 Tax=Kingella negevensis TaxID=1522312 RepID=UPI0032B4F254
MRLGNDVFVKRIQRLTNARLQIISANTNYPPFEIDLNSTDTDFTVIGKVVWLGRLL